MCHSEIAGPVILNKCATQRLLGQSSCWTPGPWDLCSHCSRTPRWSVYVTAWEASPSETKGNPLLIRQCTKPTQQSSHRLFKPEVALFPCGNAWKPLSKTFGEGRKVLLHLVGKECSYIYHKMSAKKRLENQRTQTLTLWFPGKNQ